MLQVTNQEAALSAKDDELRALKDRLQKLQAEFDELQRKFQQVGFFGFASLSCVTLHIRDDFGTFVGLVEHKN